MIRILDIVISIVLILFLFPIIVIASFLVFLQDFKSPIYISERIGKNFKSFKLFKIRTMKINNIELVVRTTRNNDPRITMIGRFIRKYKIDEMLQFINVIKNEMSLVGPRPNVKQEVDKYSKKEMGLLSIKPGITDLASICLVSMGKLFNKNTNKNINKEYFVKIKPLKNKLADIWLRNQNLQLYLTIIYLTPISIFNSDYSKKKVTSLVKKYNNKLIKKIKLLP